jgi:hypothetical protein
VVFTLHVVHREADRERLVIRRAGLLRRVRLLRVAPRLGPGDELRPRQREQVAQLRRVREVRRRQHVLRAAHDVPHRHGAHGVAAYVRPHRHARLHQPHAPAADVRREHLQQYRERDARLVAQLRHAAVARG